MKQILISWYAYNNDFVSAGEGQDKQRKREISPDSPTFMVHEHYWDNYDEHVLLNGNTKEREVELFDFLRSELQKKYRHRKITAKSVPLQDVIDVIEITQKVQRILAEYANCAIDIFASPGTPSMQTAWLLAALPYKNNVRCFHLRPKKHSTSKDKPDKFLVNLDSEIFPNNLNIAESLSSKESTGEVKVTDSIMPIFDKALQVAKTDNVSCLILGENGTGKESLARYIHEKSGRSKGPLQAINCAAFSDELLASELFGHKKGAFTGAASDKKGILVSANGGTIFLDEIGDISPRMQVSLLRVLQEKEVLPLGSTLPLSIDVRIIAATNRNLVELCEKGQFRWDLYYRLKVAQLTLPPLRDRGKGEMETLINYFINKYKTNFPSGKSGLKLTTEAKKIILAYPFPGNIREMENLIISLYTFNTNGIVEAKDLPPEILHPRTSVSDKLEDVEKRHILSIFHKCNENILKTASILGISKNTLKNRLVKYQVYP